MSPFHVELRQGMRRAWAFNLTEERMRRAVLDPWRRGEPIKLGDREWEPRDSSLRILSGSRLGAPELAMGRGWHNAARNGEDVTMQLLTEAATRTARVAVIADAPGPAARGLELLGRLGVTAIDWDPVRARILAAASVASESGPPDLELAAAILVSPGPEPGEEWLFDAGLALGALGARAIVVELGEPSPPQLSGLAVVRPQPDDPASLEVLAERLRRAGCRVRTTDD